MQCHYCKCCRWLVMVVHKTVWWLQLAQTIWIIKKKCRQHYGKEYCKKTTGKTSTKSEEKNFFRVREIQYLEQVILNSNTKVSLFVCFFFLPIWNNIRKCKTLKNSTKNVGKTRGWGNGELNWSVRKERKKPYPFWWACIQQEGQQLRKLQQEVCQWRLHEYFLHN